MPETNLLRRHRSVQPLTCSIVVSQMAQCFEDFIEFVNQETPPFRYAMSFADMTDHRSIRS